MELATRYRPNNPAELEPFQARIALLTKDIAHTNPHALKAAADEWAQREKWMPKASELIALIHERRGPGGKEINLAERYNARLLAEGKRGMKWVYDGAGQLQLISLRKSDDARPMVPPRNEAASRSPYAD